MIASTHYLLIDGLSGGSSSDAYRGAFEVQKYVFDIEVAAASGGGGGAGRPDFGPLIVDLDIGSGLAALAETVATGRAISSVRLVGVTGTGDEVYDLRLADVRITRYNDASSRKDQLAFSYGEIELTTTPLRNDGSLGRPETFSWDVARNAPGDGVPDPEPLNQTPETVSAATAFDQDVFVFVPTTRDRSIKAEQSCGDHDFKGGEPCIKADYSGGNLVGGPNRLDATAYFTAERDQAEPITARDASSRISALQVDEFF